MSCDRVEEGLPVRLLMNLGKVWHWITIAEDLRIGGSNVVEGFCPKKECPPVSPVP